MRLWFHHRHDIHAVNCLSGDPWWSEYLLQNTLGDLHVLHGNDLAEFIQGVNILDLIHELHTA